MSCTKYSYIIPIISQIIFILILILNIHTMWKQHIHEYGNVSHMPAPPLYFESRYLVFKNFPQFVVIHTVKGFGIVNKAEIDVFLDFSWFFCDPIDVGNLISGSSAFSKSSLNFWKFSVHTLLKPGLENFEHYFASEWDECNWVVVWIFFGIEFFGIAMETDLFQSCGPCWVFQICWHTEWSTFIASSFRMWNSSAGIPSPPLALFVMMLPKAFQYVWL